MAGGGGGDEGAVYCVVYVVTSQPHGFVFRLTLRSSVVGWGDAFETLLACCVPPGGRSQDFDEQTSNFPDSSIRKSLCYDDLATKCVTKAEDAQLFLVLRSVRLKLLKQISLCGDGMQMV